jgi:hypothetical protein
MGDGIHRYLRHLRVLSDHAPEACGCDDDRRTCIQAAM